jgi:hypothetical protein
MATNRADSITRRFRVLSGYFDLKGPPPRYGAEQVWVAEAEQFFVAFVERARLSC